MKRGIILGERSQNITACFRALGCEVYSCDLMPARRDASWHIQDDWENVIDGKHGPFDFAIIHPVCDEVALSGNRYYGRGKPLHDKRLAKQAGTPALWSALKEAVPHCVLEQPMNCLDQKRMGTRQIIQLYWFGAPEFKETWLYLHNVDPLEPTNKLEPPMKGTPAFNRWSKVHHEAPGPDRKEKRSATRMEIALAMAQQWSKYLV